MFVIFTINFLRIFIIIETLLYLLGIATIITITLKIITTIINKIITFINYKSLLANFMNYLFISLIIV